MSRLLPLSKGCQNAVWTVAFMSCKPRGTVFARQEVSNRAGVPSAFLSKILQTLSRAGILRSHRGSRRGYSLARPAKEISLLEVITAYDGPFGHEGCLLDDYRLCSFGNDVCAIHRQRMNIQKEMSENLASVNVAEVAKTLRKRRNSSHPVPRGERI